MGAVAAPKEGPFSARRPTARDYEFEAFALAID